MMWSIFISITACYDDLMKKWNKGVSCQDKTPPHPRLIFSEGRGRLYTGYDKQAIYLTLISFTTNWHLPYLEDPCLTISMQVTLIWTDNQQKKAQTVKSLCCFGIAELEKMMEDYKQYSWILDEVCVINISRSS